MASFYESFPQTVHFEITDKCNASCPQCARNQLGGPVNPQLPDAEITIDAFKKMFPIELVQKLNRLFMCGNYGDPMAARDTLEIYQYLREANPKISLGMNTNASARNTQWWSELGKIFAPKGNIKFGIDGLEDTHAIYRRNTDFHKIIENAKAFIEAGGEAHWEFLVFKHNEHQVEEAEAMASKLGFKRFTLKKTGRFFSNTKSKTNENQKVLKNDGTLDYIIEKPTLEKFQNKSLLKEEGIIEKFGSMETYLDETPVRCKTQEEGSFYISSEGLVFPCCWTANQLYLWYMPEKWGPIWKILKNHGGKESISLYHHPLEEILESKVFHEIKNSWSCSSVGEGKLKVCAKTCGTLFDQFKDQYK